MSRLLLEILEGFITNFSLKRLAAVSILMLIAYAIFLFYDRNTGSFGLGRLQRATDLLVQLESLKSNGITNDPQLRPVYESITTELGRELQITDEIQTPTPPSRHFWLKLSAAGLPWVLIGLFAVRDTIRKGNKASTIIPGFIISCAFFGFIGGIIPTLIWPWFNMLFYPFLQFLVVLILMALPGLLAANKKTATANK